MALAQVTQLVFFGGIALSIFGQRVLPTPDMQQFVQENKMGIMGGCFLLKILGDNLIQTGAFEVHVDGVLVFSKLTSGQVPTVQGILGMLASGRGVPAA